MSARTKEQIAAIRETRWQLEAAIHLVVGLGWDEQYNDGWTEAREAALIQAAAYLLAQNYPCEINDQATSNK
jgi:uncharacterized protein (DUF58 family)